MRAASNRKFGLTADGLVKLRKDAGMRASELADLMGVSRALVSMWESDKRVIDDDHVPRIRAAVASFVAPPPNAWFWKHVAIAGPDDCWLWQSYTRRTGYGQLTRHGTARQAHRVSWEIENGPIPAGKWILHRCDTPPCVNPAHLFLGDALLNVRDMHAKDRHRIHFETNPPQGEKHPGAKLTDERVIAMRRDYAAGGVTQKQLAERYGISSALTSFVISGRAWKHITQGRHARDVA